MILKELPAAERPRERALEKGVSNLSNAELLAILLRTGSKKNSVLETSHMILSKVSKIQDLNYLSFEELKELDGIGITKAITILSAIELGKRINQKEKDNISFSEPFEIFTYMKDVCLLKEEHVFVLYLNVKGKLIEKKLLGIGTINQTLIDSKVIFKWAYKLSSSGFILIHNHPSGDERPSNADLKITVEILKQSKTLGLYFLDHIIIGNYYYSIKEKTNIFN
jgi:DNA repair protein RadC